MSSILSRNAALRGLLDQHLAALSQEEGLAPETITSAIEAGSMVLLGNPAHAGLAPIVVGQPSRIKVNANIGTSPLCNCLHTEKRKLAVALEAGADTVLESLFSGDLKLRNGSRISDFDISASRTYDFAWDGSDPLTFTFTAELHGAESLTLKLRFDGRFTEIE